VTQESMQELYHVRQQDIAPLEQMRRQPVHVIGAGAIGSKFCAEGAKLGLDMTVYDHDVVSPENIAVSEYWPEHMGRPKAEAIQEICQRSSGTTIKAIEARITGGEALSGIIIESVDSMAERKTIWENAIVPRAKLSLIDAYMSIRMGAETGMLFLVKCPSSEVDRGWYEEVGLYTDEESLGLPCTGRGVTYCPAQAVAAAMRQVKAFLMNQKTYRRLEFDLDGFMWIVEE